MKPIEFAGVVIGCALIGLSVLAATGAPMIALSAFSGMVGGVILIEVAASVFERVE